MLLSLDPSLRSTGWAVFDYSQKLVDCGVITTKKGMSFDEASQKYLDEMAAVVLRNKNHIKQVAVEYPQIYKTARVDPNSVAWCAAFGLAGLGLAHKYACGPYTRYLPREWKGQTPKEVQNQRDYRRLSVQERAIVDGLKITKKARTDVLDAIGIGLHHLGRS